MTFQKVTEQSSHYNHLEKMNVKELLTNINKEDATVPFAIEKSIPQIEELVQAIADKLFAGGRLFYIGAGTSGRLAIVDASECPPTYGVPATLVNAIIAGGNTAVTQAVEFAEDDTAQGWKDLQQHHVSEKDVVIGITASGTTPYVIEALRQCQRHHIITGSIACNPASPVSDVANFPIEVVVGPEFVTGSTRMKSGTAQKLILNMISTSLMILLGHVEDNKMVEMQLTNEKLIDRGVKMVMQETNLSNYEETKAILLSQKSVKKAIAFLRS